MTTFGQTNSTRFVAEALLRKYGALYLRLDGPLGTGGGLVYNESRGLESQADEPCLLET